MLDFGNNGRLGNQLFQYAFMRTQAEKLQTKFYIPKWIGDEVFNLNDNVIRIQNINLPQDLNFFKQEYSDCGFSDIKINDHTNVSGYFQSEKFFDKETIRSIFKFNKEIQERAHLLLTEFNAETDVCLSVRGGDFTTNLQYYVPNLSYYKNALNLIKPRHIYLFSDDLNFAKDLMWRLGFAGTVFLCHEFPIVSLCAMTFFKKFIIGPSTFTWWGAWLSEHSEKIVIAPAEGALRPGGPVKASDFYPSEYILMPALKPSRYYKEIIFDNLDW